ncbi:alpha/beta hydrolase [Anaerosporobacter faecicola]|uniref:alpha/beta hydrolase n=1 Tax=Anaerosporobacter faecicola TaxID=2718714 RepID=UPI00143C2997|nr:alpha/beta hydrolase [Anaerosporobacter faecicola]
MEKKYSKVPSTDGIHDLHVILWKPKDDSSIKAVLQISHGMVEFMERYDSFATSLVENGYVVIGHDHLGHGKSVKDTSEWGYFVKKDASRVVVDDVHKIHCYSKKMYPNAKQILLGHSMGSFVARRYLITYGNDLDGAIIMGTGSQPAAALIAGKGVINLQKMIFGDKHKSDLIENIMFGAYNHRFSDDKHGKHWLTKDEKIVSWYCNEPGCSFTFTLNGYKMILDTITYIQKKKNLDKMPKELPMLLVSGEDDPVGNYGKGVKQAYHKYRKAGIQNIAMHLYPNDRHEILNELDRQKVYKDLQTWLDKISLSL